MRNELKRRLEADEQVYGTWMTLESPIVPEMLSTLGFDYFVFDTEHSPLDVLTVQGLIQAMRPDSGTTPIVRVKWNDLVAIKRALDIGAYGVLVPWVNSKEEAEIAVEATRYAPEGLRGCGPRRAALFDPDYYETVNDELLVICQIETVKAVENIEDICSVEGVDVTYIGPADLSASLGHLGDMSHPDVQDAIDTVYEATKDAGLAAGIHMGSGKSIEERMERVYNFITIGNDLIYLRSGVEEQMRRLGIS
ncbi:MAG: HpcH/HpaI aldolase family protein [Candidatus Bathyarchaeia archaeon]